MKICIGYGHCESGADTGATGIIVEHVENRPLGAEVERLLSLVGHEVYSARIDKASSVNASLEYRTQIANVNNVDLYVELHFNSGGGSGTETYIVATGGRAEGYAQNIVNQISWLGFKNRGVKTANFYVLRETNMPSVLVECLFVDSQEDCNSYNYKTMAKAIAEGIHGVPIVENPVDTGDKLYKVQVGAFRQRENAEKLSQELKDKGYDNFIVEMS